MANSAYLKHLHRNLTPRFHFRPLSLFRAQFSQNLSSQLFNAPIHAPNTIERQCHFHDIDCPVFQFPSSFHDGTRSCLSGRCCASSPQHVHSTVPPRATSTTSLTFHRNCKGTLSSPHPHSRSSVHCRSLPRSAFRERCWAVHAVERCEEGVGVGAGESVRG
jgi:hypothetical protein